MTDQITLEIEVNNAIMSLHQTRDPITRAQRAGEILSYLQGAVVQIAQVRKMAVAEAVQWPNMSMAKVAAELGVSKSAVAKLAEPDLRASVASDLRTRLAEGFNPPSLA